MRKIFLFLLSITLMTSCNIKQEETLSRLVLSDSILNETISALQSQNPDCSPEFIERGVRHASSLWWATDGNENEFKTFCLENFVASDEERSKLFEKLDNYFETLFGHFNWMSLKLQVPVHLKYDEILPVDEMFSGYNPSAHLLNDLYDNKIAFIVALNFPFYSLQEKEDQGKNWSRKEWAYSRMGDIFTSRIPSELGQNFAKVQAETDIYISQYNIHAGKLINEEGVKIFPDDMVLLSHWNLRDEIKANYPLEEIGLEKQKMLYRVMCHIIEQTIPQNVIDNPNLDWHPYTNEVSQNGTKEEAQPEPDTRYQKLLDNFIALKAMDEFSPLNTYIRRHFEADMEIAQPQVEELFVKFMSSDVLKEIGKLISNRLGRDLQPFDIWYDGFKARSTINEDLLSEKTRKLYPEADALEKDIQNILIKLGYSKERSKEISDKITVEPARGSGHAWGAAVKGMKSYLRTRIPDNGMDYKGYNIAVHELGHNVEQTISLYDMDYYMMNGVPNTSFTETLAFIFQRRDLFLLDINDPNPLNEAYRTLDLVWSAYEIMGVSLLDMRVWKWLYENPNCNKTELKENVIRISKEIWSEYYAPVFGIDNSPVLAIYSHAISYPLYLSAYAYGHIIEFQIEQYLKNNNFAQTVDRIYQLGRLTPNHWMNQAVGSDIDIMPMLEAGREALEKVL
ncbi:MAG: hypothetical protein FWH18_01400 [Marinilabiliaceae bacterium]|nr:hypothetical protein [Marinilabiliaceae bacterium]